MNQQNIVYHLSHQRLSDCTASACLAHDDTWLDSTALDMLWAPDRESLPFVSTPNFLDSSMFYNDQIDKVPESITPYDISIMPDENAQSNPLESPKDCGRTPSAMNSQPGQQQAFQYYNGMHLSVKPEFQDGEPYVFP
jgi:hypothetical protein